MAKFEFELNTQYALTRQEIVKVTPDNIDSLSKLNPILITFYNDNLPTGLFRSLEENLTRTLKSSGGYNERTLKKALSPIDDISEIILPQKVSNVLVAILKNLINKVLVTCNPSYEIFDFTDALIYDLSSHGFYTDKFITISECVEDMCKNNDLLKSMAYDINSVMNILYVSYCIDQKSRLNFERLTNSDIASSNDFNMCITKMDDSLEQLLFLIKNYFKNSIQKSIMDDFPISIYRSPEIVQSSKFLVKIDNKTFTFILPDIATSVSNLLSNILIQISDDAAIQVFQEIGLILSNGSATVDIIEPSDSDMNDYSGGFAHQFAMLLADKTEEILQDTILSNLSLAYSETFRQQFS